MNNREIIRVNPIDLESDVAVGLHLPLVSSDQHFFALNYTTIDQAKTNLKNLILTNKGERIMLPNYGCDLKRTLFEQQSSGLNSSVKEVIIDAVSKWLPYINIDQINVVNDDRNSYQINISIFFSLAWDPTTTEKLSINVITG